MRQLARAAQQVVAESDLAPIKRYLAMDVVTSTFMDKIAAALGVEAMFIRERKDELLGMLRAIVEDVESAPALTA